VTAGAAQRRYLRQAVVADAVVAVLAGVLCIAVRFGHDPGIYGLVPVLLPLSWVAMAYLTGVYQPRFVGHGAQEISRIFRTSLFLFSALAVASYAAQGNISRAVPLIALPVTVAGSLLVRKVLHDRLWHRRRAGVGLHRTLVVGHGDAAVDLIELLQSTERSQHHGLVPVGACIVPGDETTPWGLEDVPVVGATDDVLRALDATGADLVAVVSHPDLSGHALRRLSWALEERGVELLVSPGIIEVAGPRLSIRPIAGLSLLHLDQPRFTGGRRILKTAFDYTLASLLLVLLSPVMLSIAALIRLTSKGPALFRQTRVGTNGEPFTVYKFRSMVTNAEELLAQLREQDEGNGVLFKMKDDPRITGVGKVVRKYSLDELPQLLNVLNGTMSLVGPRPPLPAEVEGYSSDEVRRLRVRPGITGLWQVSGRSDLTWDESIRLDLRYVDNWSMGLDLSILWRTIHAVTNGSGAY
jgi:exopolysaccharide biosynthesis polyprenyl glycosylphosphotransferase